MFRLFRARLAAARRWLALGLGCGFRCFHQTTIIAVNLGRGLRKWHVFLDIRGGYRGLIPGAWILNRGCIIARGILLIAAAIIGVLVVALPVLLLLLHCLASFGDLALGLIGQADIMFGMLLKILHRHTIPGKGAVMGERLIFFNDLLRRPTNPTIRARRIVDPIKCVTAAIVISTVVFVT